ncbi:MAG: beta-lactamase family protein, partial [Candidatus Eremiobacteraeota bacterium]|nr:beta-lactamase family protein [Candidatus Eremiobacteraeota bacterium]
MIAERGAALDRLFDELLGAPDWSRRPGVVYALVAGDEVVHERAYGLAHLDFALPISAGTRFPIASITKTFAAMLATMLAHEGKLDLDAPARAYLPELHPFEPPVRVRHLLSMTSGIREEYGLAMMASGEAYGPRTCAQTRGLILAQTTQNFPAGRDVLYCNSNYSLLHGILESVGGADFGELLRVRIFAPLGLHDTAFEANFRPGKREAAGYELEGERWRPFDHRIEMSASGGIVSTLRDLQAWHRNVRRNLLEPRDLFERLTAPLTLDSGRRSDYALGIQVQRYAGRTVVGHSGGIGPYASEYLFFRDDDFAVVLLANQNETNWYERARELGLAWLDPDAEAPTRPRRGTALWSADYGDLAYGRAYRVERVPGGLRLEDRVFHETPEREFIKPNAVQREKIFALDRNDDGPPQALAYDDGNRRVELRCAAFAPETSELDTYVGTYRSNDIPGAHRIWREGGRLLLHVGDGFPPGRIVALAPVVPDLFRALDPDDGKP